MILCGRDVMPCSSDVILCGSDVMPCGGDVMSCSSDVMSCSGDVMLCATAVSVFLGGSCNPTTWRKDIVIPFLKKHAITFYNPVSTPLSIYQSSM